MSRLFLSILRNIEDGNALDRAAAAEAAALAAEAAARAAESAQLPIGFDLVMREQAGEVYEHA